jgi:hypothetical protein
MSKPKIIESKYDLQIGSRPPASKEDVEDQRKADEETKLSGILSSSGKRKFAGQTDLKGREFFVLLVVGFVVGSGSHSDMHCNSNLEEEVYI